MPVRLACVKPAASVRSEPGSNSQVEELISADHNINGVLTSVSPAFPRMNGELSETSVQLHLLRFDFRRTRKDVNKPPAFLFLV
ncbi:protein of unknown function [Methylorubrum extorquens]|uniref:Uncharacterized protein n=1 Tax=Methylorubrum extorquens TaxID=408 RepID=A0A2N9AWN7_METEX|nr:protein of unknown function [Methylorubrum extorquens]SOR31278.1 protein of unknown function [Methylorubrum extorquens]SOR31739.1 protein of unknown function [Methylorubrum extorquens]SOR31986.1 protein of unknown function [Methylorubrum extorquens]SOR32322.1 protein of unknown function [Methylorubrum extorquens]